VKVEGIRWVRAAAVAGALAVAGISVAEGRVILRDLDGDGQIRILAFGDSITAGTGDNEEDPRDPAEFGGYPARLQAIWGVPVVNGGKGGETSSQGANRLPSVLQNVRPDIVIILEGANDLSSLNSKPIVPAYDSMVSSVQAVGAIPLVATLTPYCCDRAERDPLASQASAGIRSLAAARGVPVIDFREAFAPGDSFNPASGLIWVPEGLHPRPAGYDLMGIVAAAAFKAPPRCNGFEVTIFGTDGDDTIVGTEGPDVIHGLKGNDAIGGAGGDDVICGGSGDDFLDGGDGNDLLRGKKGNDTLAGGNGTDECRGDKGVDAFVTKTCETALQD
jgi:lysophospholipase L1-like esterase